jgi:hypothetical protein
MAKTVGETGIAGVEETAISKRLLNEMHSNRATSKYIEPFVQRTTVSIGNRNGFAIDDDNTFLNFLYFIQCNNIRTVHP